MARAGYGMTRRGGYPQMLWISLSIRRAGWPGEPILIGLVAVLAIWWSERACDQPRGGVVMRLSAVPQDQTPVYALEAATGHRVCIMAVATLRMRSSWPARGLMGGSPDEGRTANSGVLGGGGVHRVAPVRLDRAWLGAKLGLRSMGRDRGKQ